MKKEDFSIELCAVIVVALLINTCIIANMFALEEKKLNTLQQSNKELIQQNKELEDKIYKYNINISDYQSATDAIIADLSGDIEELKLEKEVNESDLHKNPEPKVEIKGIYQLTAYIATGNPCADGSMPQVGYTAACNDPSLWHKWVHIDGYGDYYICDRGGMASNVIDIFVGSYDEAIQFGRRSAEVSIIEK